MGKFKDKYDVLAGRLYEAMVKRSKRRGHEVIHNGKGFQLAFTNREFQLWCKEQPGFIQNCDIWFAAGSVAYAKNKPSCNRLDDNKGYTFDNIEMITWGEHCKHTAKSRLSGEGKQTATHGIDVFKDGVLVHTSVSLAGAYRFINPKAKNSGGCQTIANICKGIGQCKQSYGYTFGYAK